MRGEIGTGRKEKRHPLDWYVDEIWCARQLRAALNDFRLEREWGLTVWYPCCGMGNTLVAAWEAGLATIGSDVVNNFAEVNFATDRPELRSPEWFAADFRSVDQAPRLATIVCNPPYSYVPDIAETFVRRALTLAAGRVCVLVPNKWLASQRRHQLFAIDHPPTAILHLTQRASMPPGDMIAAMGDRAFRGGMVDYCWVVWEAFRPTKPGETRVFWLPPVGRAIEPLQVLA